MITMPSDGAGATLGVVDRGYAVVPGLLATAEMSRVSDRLTEILASNVDAVDDAGGTVYVPGLESDTVIAGAFDKPPLITLLQSVLGGEPTLETVRYRSPRPGHGLQALHRDQPWPAPNGVWASATVIIGLTAFTKDNGSPRLVPGSHTTREPFVARSLRFHHPREVSLVGERGTAFVFTGACLHSGTTNRSTDERPGLQATFIASPVDAKPSV